MDKIKSILPGFLLAIAIALPSWFLGQTFTVIGGPIFAILIGMLLANKAPISFNNGIRFTSKKMLQLAIVLLGFQMNLFNVIKLGGQSVILIAFTISSVFITAIILSRLLKVEKNSATLIGVGTAICGGSAIAATAPVINANDDEVAAAISTIFLFNIIAVLIFPPLGRLLNMTDTGFGIWAGLAINDTSSVVAAAQVWSPDALKLATIVKLTRTLMILPVTLFLGIRTAKLKMTDTRINIKSILPWFIFGFLLASVIATGKIIPAEAIKGLTTLGKFLIVTAMAAIGLNTNLKQLISNGRRPLVMGLSCWIVVVAVALIVQRAMELW